MCNVWSDVMIKGTVRQYRSRAITHYFTGSEIMEPKVYVILWYLLINMHVLYTAKLKDHKSIQEDRTA